MSDPILITGAPRSGTSMVAHIFAAHGVYFGDTRPEHTTDEFNPTGYYENIPVRDGLVIPLLKELTGDGVAEVTFPDTASLTAVDGFREYVLNAMRIPDGKQWAYKDPKSCLLWPVWQEAFPNARWVVCVRNYDDVAVSLVRMGNAHKITGIDKGKIAAQAYKTAVDSMPGDVLVLHTDDIVRGELSELSDVFAQLGIEMDSRLVASCVRPDAWHCSNSSGAKPPLYVQSLQGLGDNIYQRPLMQELANYWEVYIDSPYPELYADLDVHCIRPTKDFLRTQAKHWKAKDESVWKAMPDGATSIRMAYGNVLHREQLPRTLARCAGLDVYPVMSLPDFGEPPIKSDRPIAFVRPVTARKEWLNVARNPASEYIELAVEHLKETHCIVTVADLEDGKEWLVNGAAIPDADYRFEHGELTYPEMMALFQSADVVVGGVGWIVPASIAAHKKAIIVGGGQLAHNHISRITCDGMDLSNIHYIAPDNGCWCVNMRHNCDKYIPRFDKWLEALPI